MPQVVRSGLAVAGKALAYLVDQLAVVLPEGLERCAFEKNGQDPERNQLSVVRHPSG
ncbi:hypothetical protein [Dactylosporangium salmoneum]|uniref:hypothetical protein n=1 Tax=Dactylosporangium salmoneum TaxID=53361 RepID=UPI0031D12931